jgi:cytidylate kinase
MKPAFDKEPGPVVTISRECGCSGRNLSLRLAEELNNWNQSHGIHKEWKFISKEILEKAARELDVSPTDISYVFHYEERNLLGDIFASYASKYYKSEKQIRKTIGDVIRSSAGEGNAIILGRAGVVLTRDIPKSLHIGLEAPLEWRTIMVSERYNISLSEAKKFAIEMDKKRERFRNAFEGRNTDYTRFDVVFNRMTLTEDEIVHSIVRLMEEKKII